MYRESGNKSYALKMTQKIKQLTYITKPARIDTDTLKTLFQIIQMNDFTSRCHHIPLVLKMFNQKQLC